MDLTKPIDITAINNTAKQYDKQIRTLNLLDVMNVLKKFGLRTGFKESVDIHEFQNAFGNSKKYTGTFTGGIAIGAIVPRNLKIYPIVYEMMDEPERYRATFINDVACGKVLETTSFELWLVERGIEAASEELYNVLFTAVRSDVVTDTGIEFSFNGLETLIANEITSTKISAANKNYYDAGVPFTMGNIGDKLKEMWRSAHPTMKQKGGIMYLSIVLAEMYDDWFFTTHDKWPQVDMYGQTLLEGSNGLVSFVKLSNMNNQRVILTMDGNITYGTESINDMKNLQAFQSGNPYVFTATMKYTFGLQFESVHQRKFIVSKVYDAVDVDI